ncbi:MAG: DUF4097 family beta strand repeat protein [Phycisphaerae bacterium]|nr:DUF4097 family beta strand repeat protein [Gemmatimonadaceae bacterium]
MYSMTFEYSRRVRLVAAAALLAAGTGSSVLNAQSRDDAFSWSGTVPAGRSLIVKNINGPIRVERSTTNRVEVTAEKRWRRGNPNDVRIEQPRGSNGNVLICALFNEESTCDESGIHSPRNRGRNDNDRNDVSVHFVVRVPDGIRVDVATVNGGLEVNGVSAEVDANTVNGTIDARSSGGPVRAKTVNGSINISMGSFNSTDDLEYETVNGSVTLELPSNFGGQMELSTVNGRVNTDFPITITGTLSPRRLRGSIGTGSARIRASTVNGSVTLRRNN